MTFWQFLNAQHDNIVLINNGDAPVILILFFFIDKISFAVKIIFFFLKIIGE